MKNNSTSSHKPFFRKWFSSFILLLSCLPDTGDAAAINISCPEKVEKWDVSSVKCVLDVNELDRKYGCDSSSDRINFTVNPEMSSITSCSVQFLHSHFCSTIESSPTMCQCIGAEDNIFTYQYYFQPSDADMEAEIFCSVGCYKLSKYFLIESDRCKVFNMRPDQNTKTSKSNNSPGATDDENVVKKMLATMLKQQEEKLLANFNSVKSQLTSVQETVEKAVADIGVLQTRISSLEASNKTLKEKDELNSGPHQSTQTLKSNDTAGKENNDRVDEKMLATMSENQQEKLLADVDSLKSKPTVVQDSLNRSDADIGDRNSKITFLYRKFRVQEESEYRASWRSTAGKIITTVVGIIAIVVILGVVLRQTRFKGASSRCGAVMKKHKLRPCCKEIKKEKNGVEHELSPMSY